MRIEQMTGVFGAEIFDVDVRALDEAGFREIEQALLSHGVVAVRDQDLAPADQLAFVRRFGDIHYHPHAKGLPEQPEVLEILKTETDRDNFGGGWHTDQMFAPVPASYTCLYALELPPAGGDTLFACMRNAYRTLSPGMRRLAEGLRTENRSVAAQLAGRNQSAAKAFGSMRATDASADEAPAAHPLVMRHPVTGDPSLYIGLHTICFEDMTLDESRPLIDWMMGHMTQPENVCRLRWRLGTLAIWDNRSVLHNAINDYHGHRRRMHRITVTGAAPHAYAAAA